LLLLGDKPSSLVANRVLTLIGISNTFTASFSRKFELVSGWSILKTILPPIWDTSVNQAAFDVLLGRFSHIGKVTGADTSVIVCPNIAPAILAALAHGLGAAATDADTGQSPNLMSPSSETSAIEALVEEILDLHASSTTFRQVFKSHQTTQIFVDGFKSFADSVASMPTISPLTSRLLEKTSHLGLAIALDPMIGGGQKREVREEV
jgi:hypothetical protein